MSIQNLLEDQVAIITGASRGVGQATALTLAEAGAAVVLAARNEGQLTSVNDEIKNSRPVDEGPFSDINACLCFSGCEYGRCE